MSGSSTCRPSASRYSYPRPRRIRRIPGSWLSTIRNAIRVLPASAGMGGSAPVGFDPAAAVAFRQRACGTRLDLRSAVGCGYRPAETVQSDSRRTPNKGYAAARRPIEEEQCVRHRTV
ncbi:hypothetical protein MICRO8M_100004 [Microbacterium sp. 8M]|nr:hypothetical protein MICRO8M_100004 [Microbacterium sp. 8M]